VGAPNVEEIPSGEAEDVEVVADMINTVQETQYS
jgi:hypothetical protein